MSSNFGDELNTVLWPRLLPGFFDGDPSVRFLGIGSVLDGRHSSQAIKIVAGSGYGGYERRPDLDANWVIHWVRGPRTAATLGLPRSLALGDPAVLVPKAINMPHAGGREIGFMPHFESAAWGAWQQVADLAGVRLIDPRSPPLGILRAIGRCRLVLSEALHGVIVADALRVPWIAIRPRARIHRTKWLDWAETMALQPQFHPLPASTLAEWMGTSRLTSFHATRAWLARYGQRLDQMTSERLVTQAAKALVAAASAAPQLSAATVLDRCQSRMLEAVETVRVQPLLALSASPGVVHPQSCLQPGNDSAYQLTPIS